MPRATTLPLTRRSSIAFSTGSSKPVHAPVMPAEQGACDAVRGCMRRAKPLIAQARARTFELAHDCAVTSGSSNMSAVDTRAKKTKVAEVCVYQVQVPERGQRSQRTESRYSSPGQLIKRLKSLKRQPTKCRMRSSSIVSASTVNFLINDMCDKKISLSVTLF